MGLSEIRHFPCYNASQVSLRDRIVLWHLIERRLGLPADAELKDLQGEFISAALQHHDLIGRFPTGYGKSLLFQACILCPDPTRSLNSSAISLTDQSSHSVVNQDGFGLRALPSLNGLTPTVLHSCLHSLRSFFPSMQRRPEKADLRSSGSHSIPMNGEC